MDDEKYLHDLQQIKSELEKGILYLNNLATSINEKITALEKQQLDKDTPDLFSVT